MLDTMSRLWTSRVISVTRIFLCSLVRSVLTISESMARFWTFFSKNAVSADPGSSLLGPKQASSSPHQWMEWHDNTSCAGWFRIHSFLSVDA